MKRRNIFKFSTAIGIGALLLTGCGNIEKKEEMQSQTNNNQIEELQPIENVTINIDTDIIDEDIEVPIHEQIIEQDQEKRNNDTQQEIEPSNEDSVNNEKQEESEELEFNYDFEEEVKRFAKKYAEIKDEASLEEKEMFITSHFDDYVADGYIEEYFYTVDDFLGFKYSNGVLGGVMLKDFDPMLN